MKSNVPVSTVTPSHPDYPVLSKIEAEILSEIGGLAGCQKKIPCLLRACIDDVMLTPKTGRTSYDQLEKTEKTYIGTRVEIEIRDLLGVPKGLLDTVIAGYDTDIKHTMGSNWMIPVEAFGQPCILTAADEGRAVCFFGLVVAKPEYLTQSQNRDEKKSLRAEAFENVLWILRDYPYQRNFWQTIPEDTVARILSGKGGNKRVTALFKEVQNRPIPRDVINAAARQKDFTRRLRSDAGRGTRDVLAKQGIIIISEQKGTELIKQFGLRECGSGEFMSYTLKSTAEREAARLVGFDV